MTFHEYSHFPVFVGNLAFYNIILLLCYLELSGLIVQLEVLFLEPAYLLLQAVDVAESQERLTAKVKESSRSVQGSSR